MKEIDSIFEIGKQIVGETFLGKMGNTLLFGKAMRSAYPLSVEPGRNYYLYFEEGYVSFGVELFDLYFATTPSYMDITEFFGKPVKKVMIEEGSFTMTLES